jgi:hypothetical protein
MSADMAMGIHLPDRPLALRKPGDRFHANRDQSRQRKRYNLWSNRF